MRGAGGLGMGGWECTDLGFGDGAGIGAAEYPVWCVAWRPCGRWVYSGGEDDTVRVWDAWAGAGGMCWRAMAIAFGARRRASAVGIGGPDGAGAGWICGGGVRGGGSWRPGVFGGGRWRVSGGPAITVFMRRAFLIAAGAFAGLAYFASRKGKAEEAPVDTPERVVRPAAEWRARLSAQQYHVARLGGTDTPYTGTYYSLKDPGTYVCVCCGLLLFRSEDKFDSGTGWPSFSAPAEVKNVLLQTDGSLMMERTEVLCRRCAAHLGHVFPDGPPPTNQRYCINESSLRFIKRS